MLELMMLIKSILYANAIKVEKNEAYIIVLTFFITCAIFSFISHLF